MGETRQDAHQSNGASICRWSRMIPVAALIAFALFYTVVKYRVHPEYLHYADDLEIGTEQVILRPIHYGGWDFVAEHLGHPGGAVEYVGAFACQYFGAPHVAAAILTFTAVAAFLAFRTVLSGLGLCAPTTLLLSLPAAIAVIFSRLTFDLSDCVALLCSVTGVAVYVRLRRRSVRLVCFTVALALLYYGAGGACLLFAAACALVEILANRRYLTGLVYLAVGAALPYAAGGFLFDLAPLETYGRHTGLYPFPGVAMGLAWAAAYALLLGGVGAAAWLGRTESVLSPLRTRWAHAMGGPLKAVVGPVLLGAVTALICVFGQDDGLRRQLRLNYFAHMKRWPQVLEAARGLGREQFVPQIIHHVNRALIHTGKLETEMFAFPQAGQILVPGEWAPSFNGTVDVLLELGAVNSAEHAACEILEVRGPRPTVLAQLATINIVKREPDAAKLFLNVLSRHVMWHRWADSRLAALEEDPLLTSDPEIERIRSLRPQKPSLVSSSGEDVLLALLDRDRNNRLALTYLMAHYLLTGQVEKVVQNLWRVPHTNRRSPPRYYAEAILIYTSAHGRLPPLYGWQIDRQTVVQFNKAADISQAHPGEIDAMDKAFAKAMPDSYLRYYATGRSGGQE